VNASTVSTRVLLDDRDELLDLLLHRLEGVSWSAMMLPFSRPVSCCGKKSLGIDVEEHVQAERPDRDDQDEQEWSSTQPRLRS
jgi:hypothetical protein